MLKVIHLENLQDLNKLGVSATSEIDNQVIQYAIDRRDDGRKPIFKLKETRNGVYLNMYCYDKYSWRYLLNYTVELVKV